MQLRRRGLGPFRPLVWILRFDLVCRGCRFLCVSLLLSPVVFVVVVIFVVITGTME
jgi:hypothetical protein